ncbi:MAG: long-chain fatty acid--CoA ligase [Austwickia sp.]|jgi:fatty-acyl-CoA synthase|nr:long-chain fatty acid--CoA ligase [Austwickia sp.]MBK8437190.1 long-chain fatty acid--CoA ligase [Austwickia sp.]MBK9102421.1 long-chain fatty acid--CoA ligase [Austwickia sp.]
MESTMQAPPLLIGHILTYGTTCHANQEVVTWGADGARRMTFRQVGEQAAQLAHALRSLGITGDQRVATFMWNNAEHLVAYLAVPAMGAVLHAWNIRLSPDQVIYIANHAGAEVVMVDDTLLAPFRQMLPHLPKIRHVIVNGTVDDATMADIQAVDHVEGAHRYADLLADHPTTYAWPDDLNELDASSMCYTSGTTGNPKGVAYSHRANYLHAVAVAMTLKVQEGDRVLVVVPLFHANGWGLAYAALAAGASMMMPDRYLQGAPLAQFIEAEKITKGAGVPTVWNDLLQTVEKTGGDLSSCTMLMVGGAPCPPALMRAFHDRHNIDLIHGWGMTEMTPVGTLAFPPTAVKEGSDEYWRYRATQGRLLVGVEGRLTTPEGTLAPHDGESVGEVEVRGPWITASYYLNGTESEAEKADMQSKFHDGWLRTGDVGTLSADGYLVLTDRAKDVIKSGGEWISSVLLENAIMAHPEVVEASVVGIPDEKWGERPLATVVLREGSTATLAELADSLTDKVAKWQVPEHWVIVDEVPKTSVGKFDKKVIRSRYADGDFTVNTVR